MYLQVPSTSQSPMPSNTIHPAVESRTNSVTSIMQHAYRDLRASITGDHGSSIVSAIGRRMSTKKGVTFARPKTALAGALSRKLNGKSKKGEISNVVGDIDDDRIIDDVFAEVDVDGNGLIDYDEFSSMVRNYMTDDDVSIHTNCTRFDTINFDYSVNRIDRQRLFPPQRDATYGTITMHDDSRDALCTIQH
uniref:EF-hand domain-containing protein n=1 Tax=Plectus sambesii TaxID=2011161 RepID=A0A914VXK1_9BILA